MQATLLSQAAGRSLGHSGLCMCMTVRSGLATGRDARLAAVGRADVNDPATVRADRTENAPRRRRCGAFVH
jgi:hypothetical protein